VPVSDIVVMNAIGVEPSVSRVKIPGSILNPTRCDVVKFVSRVSSECSFAAPQRSTVGGPPKSSISVKSPPIKNDTGSNFRISSCQYLYNLSASALGVGTYRVDIKINGTVVGSGIFQLK
jgi:hypothetical protein